MEDAISKVFDTFIGTLFHITLDDNGSVKCFVLYSDEGEDIIVENKKSYPVVAKNLLKKKIRVLGRLISQERSYKLVSCEKVIDDTTYSHNSPTPARTYPHGRYSIGWSCAGT